MFMTGKGIILFLLNFGKSQRRIFLVILRIIDVFFQIVGRFLNGFHSILTVGGFIHVQSISQ
jgi:hypothetical protein